MERTKEDRGQELQGMLSKIVALGYQHEIRHFHANFSFAIPEAVLHSSLPTMLAEDDHGLYYCDFRSHSGRFHRSVSEYDHWCGSWRGSKLAHRCEHHTPTPYTVMDIYGNFSGVYFTTEEYTRLRP